MLRRHNNHHPTGDLHVISPFCFIQTNLGVCQLWVLASSGASEANKEIRQRANAESDRTSHVVLAGSGCTRANATSHNASQSVRWRTLLTLAGVINIEYCVRASVGGVPPVLIRNNPNYLLNPLSVQPTNLERSAPAKNRRIILGKEATMFGMSLKTLPCALVSLGLCCAYAGQYTLKDLGILGGAVVGFAINNNGQVTTNGTSTAFLYQPERGTT